MQVVSHSSSFHEGFYDTIPPCNNCNIKKKSWNEEECNNDGVKQFTVYISPRWWSTFPPSSSFFSPSGGLMFARQMWWVHLCSEAREAYEVLVKEDAATTSGVVDHL